MKRASEVKLRGNWSGEPADRIVLAFDQRWRRRLTLTTQGGETFLLDLPQAQVLRSGDALVMEDGRLIVVEAAGEELLEVKATPAISLARLAWHLGNRHTPTAIADARILVRKDHVLADMLRRLGAEVGEVVAPFDPEGGAYATGHGGHNHDH